MDQKALVSGIGNYLVAEILYDAKINPHNELNKLSPKELNKLAHSMRKITKYAYYYNTIGYMIPFKHFMKKHIDAINNNIFPNYHPDIKGKPDEHRAKSNRSEAIHSTTKSQEIGRYGDRGQKDRVTENLIPG